MMGEKQYGIDPATLNRYAEDVKEVAEMGVQVAIVVGGGNIFRGVEGASRGMNRNTSDYMGMLATVINGLALQDALERHGMTTRLQSALDVHRVCEPYIHRRAVRHLEKGRIVIFAAGTGNPFFTTDTAATLRAIEIDADVILKATRVDGVYSADPEKHPDAVRYETIGFDEVIDKRLNVMDMTAFVMSQENSKKIVVFDMNVPGNLKRVVMGESVGTLVH
ncbi:MAG: UMP kinase [Bacteroidia bacterium]|nr:UMP kinase [Bacteroidia bacterium]